jgi:pSer/pThr/pTyr-binding forkhead associated (FHA) protein
VEALIMEKYTDELCILIAQGGPLNGLRWTLSEPKLVGRDALCDIVIPDRQVSRHHTRLTPTDKGILIEDLDSKNGTHVNGRQLVEGALLQDGDSIEIALAQKFIFLNSDATLPLERIDSKLQTDYVPNGVQSASTTSSEFEPVAAPIYRLFLDKRSHRVWIRAKERGVKSTGSKLKGKFTEIEVDPPLSASQFRLLETLYDQQGQVLSRQDIEISVWGSEEAIGVSEQALDALIRRLRDRLASVDPLHTYIITVRGHGLRLDNPLLAE